MPKNLPNEYLNMFEFLKSERMNIQIYLDYQEMNELTSGYINIPKDWTNKYMNRVGLKKYHAYE